MPAVVILSDVRTDYTGFQSLAKLDEHLGLMSGGRVDIDCRFVDWFDANMAAVLGGILERHRATGIHAVLVNLKPAIKVILAKNGFLPDEPIQDNFGTTIPYRKLSVSEAVEFAIYVEEKLLTQPVPKMSEAVKRKFLEGLDEIFNNSVIHSKTTQGIHACGQAFPKKGLLSFTIADFGIGIPTTVRSVAGPTIDAADAIEMAMQKGFTSRQGDVPGGLGLKILKEFIALNRGLLTVASDNGYWEMTAGRIQKLKLPYPIHGTAISLQINTSDKNVYRLKGELNPWEVL